MIHFLLPAYNEENALPALLDTISAIKFPNEEWRVVAVDDGSSDRTPEILSEFSSRIPLTVLTHSPNMGLGRAMRTGLSHLSKIIGDNDAIVALDADNTQNPELTAKMRVKQLAENLDIVIASRYCEDENEKGEEVGLAVHRKILSRGASWLLDSFFHLKGTRDYTCGFRLYSGQIIKKAFRIYGDNFPEEADFVCMAEILIKLDHIGGKIGEVPLTLRYDLKHGASKLKIMRTILRYFRLIWRYRIMGDLKRYPTR
ncbi:MAG: glycosyltransferase family 2 protein [bacterium]